jgi:hypothetical protein
MMRVQGHFQHAAYFRRYREFIQQCVLHSAADFRRVHYRPSLKRAIDLAAVPVKFQTVPMRRVPLPADLVVYLRLGDKSEAGDTLLTFQSGYYDAVLSRIRNDHEECWVVTNSIAETRALDISAKFKCHLQTADSYSDWTVFLLATRTVVMAASTFVYFPTLLGSAIEVHYPAVGFFHNKHNVCMRQRKENSHFGQMRLLPGRSRSEYDVGGKTIVYHDIYSRQFFLTYDEIEAVFAAMPCAALIYQHVCPDNSKLDDFRESRYCYLRQNATSDRLAATARDDAQRIGMEVVATMRKHTAPATAH